MISNRYTVWLIIKLLKVHKVFHAKKKLKLIYFVKNMIKFVMIYGSKKVNKASAWPIFPPLYRARSLIYVQYVGTNHLFLFQNNPHKYTTKKKECNKFIKCNLSLLIIWPRLFVDTEEVRTASSIRRFAFETQDWSALFLTMHKLQLQRVKSNVSL